MTRVWECNWAMPISYLPTVLNIVKKARKDFREVEDRRTVRQVLVFCEQLKKVVMRGITEHKRGGWSHINIGCGASDEVEIVARRCGVRVKKCSRTTAYRKWNSCRTMLWEEVTKLDEAVGLKWLETQQNRFCQQLWEKVRNLRQHYVVEDEDMKVPGVVYLAFRPFSRSTYVGMSFVGFHGRVKTHWYSITSNSGGVQTCRFKEDMEKFGPPCFVRLFNLPGVEKVAVEEVETICINFLDTSKNTKKRYGPAEKSFAHTEMHMVNALYRKKKRMAWRRKKKTVQERVVCMQKQWQETRGMIDGVVKNEKTHVWRYIDVLKKPAVPGDWIKRRVEKASLGWVNRVLHTVTHSAALPHHLKSCAAKSSSAAALEEPAQ